MEKRLILHIGMPKTGSSSIQETLKTFNDGHTAYMQFGPRNHSNAALALSFQKDRHAKQRLPMFAQDLPTFAHRRRVLIDRIETFAKTAPPCTIFSAESAYHFDAHRFAKLTNFLGRRFGPIHVIGYIRPPASFINSSFQQTIKTGRSTFRVDTPDYRRKLEKIDGAPFVEKVTFRRFARDDLHGGSVVQDFLALTGLEVPKADIIEEINTGMSLETTCLLFFHNRLKGRPDSSPERLKERLALVDALGQLSGQRLSLDPALWAHFPIDDEMSWVRDTLNVDLTEDSAAQGPILTSEDQMRQIAKETLARFDAHCAAATLTQSQHQSLQHFAQTLSDAF